MPFLRIESYNLRFDCNLNSGESAEGRGGEFPLRVPPLLSPNTVVPREESFPQKTGWPKIFIPLIRLSRKGLAGFFFARLGIKEITLSLWPGRSVGPPEDSFHLPPSKISSSLENASLNRFPSFFLPTDPPPAPFSNRFPPPKKSNYSGSDF